MTSLSNDDYDLLEDLFNAKYRKCLIIYRLIKEYSDSIESLYYKESGENILKIEILTNKSSVKDIVKSMNNKKNRNISIHSSSNKIKIELEMDELIDSPLHPETVEMED